MKKILTEIKNIAQGAGQKIMSYYNADKGITYKKDNSPLTLADQAAHHFILEHLHQLYPEIPIISEESAVPNYQERRAFQRFWLIDPLDGTKEFIKRNGEFTVNIALIEKEQVILGVVTAPTQNTTYMAVKGLGAWVSQGDEDPRQLIASKRCNFQNLTVSVSRSHPSEKLNSFLRQLPGLIPKPIGSSLKFCAIAENQVDLYPRFSPLNEWDTAAAQIVTEESGGQVVGLDGKPLRYNKPSMKHEAGFLATRTPELTEFLLQKLATSMPQV